MKKLNIAVISGGSGNDSLINGIRNLYPKASIKVIVNAYDSGKSTGICRKVTDTLGVSDIRKNHIRMYKTNKFINKNIVEFYDGRYNFTKGKEKEEIKNKLSELKLSNLNSVIDEFFSNETAYDYEYNDFSIANIVYSQMYKMFGYEYTNNLFSNMLGLDDFVILNSFDNIYINAHLENGTVLEDEGDIVRLDNPNNKIVKLDYIGKQEHGLNKKAIDEVNNADLIIISTGTFWSSIYPTLEYLDFYKYINKAKAKKIWAINSKEDHDAFGVSSNDYISIVEKLGLDLSQFTILENLDAVKSLKQKNNNYKIVYKHMENNNGKHNSHKFASAILSIYYGLENSNKYNKFIFDFDDTLWARDADKNTHLYSISLENLDLVKKFIDNSIIISGNSLSHVIEKINIYNKVKDTDFNINICADANTSFYKQSDKNITAAQELVIKDWKYIYNWLKNTYGIEAVPTKNNLDEVTCLKIKPLTQLERLTLNELINKKIKSDKLNLKSEITGKTTIDILNKNNSKGFIFKYLKLDSYTTLYIGDEVNNGNDKDIAKMCNFSINVNDVEDTNLILKLLDFNREAN